MPRKKQEELEQEIDTSKAPVEETFTTRWFKSHAVNNARELKIICDLTAESAYNQFYIRSKKDHTQVFGVIFYATFMAILDFIKSKEKIYNEFTIEIANSINIGYTNNDDERNEKIGNFMPILEYIGVNRNIVEDAPSGYEVEKLKTYQNCMRWKDLNIKKTVEYFKEIQEKAGEILNREYKVLVRTNEAILPIFCIFMDNISNLLKQKFKEAEGTDVSEVSMNVFGLFDAFYRYDIEDHEEIIDFQPNITMKLALKSDETAARGN